MGISIFYVITGIGANSGTKPIWEIGKKDWDWVMGVNYQGVLYGIQSFLPHMTSHGEEGHVITTVSMAGLLPGAGTYGVSKHAVMALTEALSRDLITRNSKINASVLCPGFVDANIDKSERNRASIDGIGGPRSNCSNTILWIFSTR